MDRTPWIRAPTKRSLDDRDQAAGGALPGCYQWEKLAEVCFGLPAERVTIDGVDEVTFSPARGGHRRTVRSDR